MIVLVNTPTLKCSQGLSLSSSIRSHLIVGLLRQARLSFFKIFSNADHSMSMCTHESCDAVRNYGCK